MAGEGPVPYQSEDEQYGALLRRLLNPPPENEQQVAQNAAPVVQRPAAPMPAVQAPAPAPATPVAKPATPGAVTQTGNTPSFYQRAQQGALSATDQAAQNAAAHAAMPSPTVANAPLEQRRTALATPIPYRDPTTGKVLTNAVDPLTGQPIDPAQMYKPGIGTRIARGIAAAKKGGISGVIDPSAVGATPYSAPNAAYQTAEQTRAAQIAPIERQEAQNLANYKAESDRYKDIGTEAGKVGTAYKDVASAATAQQTAEQKADYNQQIEATRKELADVRQQLADQGGVPKTYEQAVIASNDPTLDAAKRQQYAASARQIAATEVKKFQYANQAVGDADPRRQPMIDDATAKVNLLNMWEYNPDANDGRGGFYDPAKGENDRESSATLEEFTAMKNKIAADLDKQLTSKKLRPLGVRFNVKDTTPGNGQPAAQPTAPAQTAPKSALEVQQGQVYNGYKYTGGDRTQKSNWQKVGQ